MPTPFNTIPQHKPLLMALLAVCLLFSSVPPAAANTDSSIPNTRKGYQPPPGVSLIKATGTGRTTGHIANLSLSNDSDAPVALPALAFFIPSGGKYQAYVGRIEPGQILPPGTGSTVEVRGFCATVRRPPVPAEAPIPPAETWQVATGEFTDFTFPAGTPFRQPGRALIPGSNDALPGAVSIDREPGTAAPLLLAAVQHIEQAAARLQQSGELQTPFSANPEREREAVIQQTFWMFAAELENDPYTQEEFTRVLEAQYETGTGVALADAPEQDRERIKQGSDDFWAAFELVGVEAKVLNHEPTTASTPEKTTETDSKDETAATDAPACGRIEGTVSTNPERLFKGLMNVLVYVAGSCEYCPPKPVREAVVITEGYDGIQPSFVVVPKNTTVKLVNGYDKEIHFAPGFTPSPIEGDPQPTHNLDALGKGESTEITPTKSASGNSTGDYLVKSRYHERSDGVMFVTPNDCYAIADEKGHYSIGELPPGTYQLKVYTRPKRTHFAEANVTVEEGKTTIQDFVLQREKKPASN